MRTYLITYDLASSARHTLSSAIMQLGELLGATAGNNLVCAVLRARRCFGTPAEAASRRRGWPADPAGGDAMPCCSTRRFGGFAGAAKTTAKKPEMSLRFPCLRYLKPRRPDLSPRLEACPLPGSGHPPSPSALRPPLQEVGDEPQAQRLALLRVELGARDVVDPDHRGHRSTVIGFGHQRLAIRH